MKKTQMAKHEKEMLTELADFRETGDKQTYPLQIRMSQAERKILNQLAKMSGYRTLSAYGRSKMLSADSLALDRKLAQVLEIVKKLVEEKNE